MSHRGLLDGLHPLILPPRHAPPPRLSDAAQTGKRQTQYQLLAILNELAAQGEP